MNSQPETGDIFPSLTYDDAPAAIDWLCRAFGFCRRLVVPGPNQTIQHSELSLGKAVIMVSSPKANVGRLGPGQPAVTSQGNCVRIDDPDSHFRQAIACGAEIIQELKDEDYGSRGYMARDPEGHMWYFGTYRPGVHWQSGSDTIA